MNFHTSLKEQQIYPAFYTLIILFLQPEISYRGLFISMKSVFSKNESLNIKILKVYIVRLYR